MYAKKTLETAGNKTDGEKLFVSLTDEKKMKGRSVPDILPNFTSMFPGWSYDRQSFMFKPVLRLRISSPPPGLFKNS